MKEANIMEKSRLVFIPGYWIVQIHLYIPETRWYGSIFDVGLIQRWSLYREKNISPFNESHSLEAGLYTWILDSMDPSLMRVLFSAGHYTVSENCIVWIHL
jgi:hypothetical protein